MSGSASADDGLRMIILCDFDDTAAAQNVGQMLLERFQPEGATPWEEVKARYANREISLAEYQEIAFRQLTAPVEEQFRYAQEAGGLRSGFAELAEHCARRGVALGVVSHGLDYYVEAILKENGVDVPVSAVATSHVDGVPSFSYDFADEGCEWWPGNCKCKALEEYRKRYGGRLVYAGDSASDACPALRADFVFARAWLAGFCKEQGLPYAELLDFHAVIDYIETHLGSEREGV